MYFMTILLRRNCTSSYESDKIVKFSALRSEMLDFWKLKKYNKLVNDSFPMKFESADLIYQPRGIGKCNKMGGITTLIPLKDMYFGKSLRRTGQVYST
jgi:hypothetical protein